MYQSPSCCRWRLLLHSTSLCRGCLEKCSSSCCFGGLLTEAGGLANSTALLKGEKCCSAILPCNTVWIVLEKVLKISLLRPFWGLTKRAVPRLWKTKWSLKGHLCDVQLCGSELASLHKKPLASVASLYDTD